MVGIAALVAYFQLRLPEGVTPMGEDDATLAWVSLATAVLSLLTALAGLVKAVLDARAR